MAVQNSSPTISALRNAMRSRSTSVWYWVWLASGGLVLLTWIGTTDKSPGRILLQTILLAALALAIAIPLGLWCAHRWLFGSRLERWLVTLIVSLALVPLCLQVAAWESILGKIRAWIVSPNQPWEFVVSNWCMAAWIHGVSGASWLTIFFVVGFWTRGWVLEQQALLDANSTQVFWRITLVRMRPVLFAAALWMLVLVAREIAVTDIYQIGTYAQHIYLGYALDRLPWSMNLPEDQSIWEYLGFVRQFALAGWLIASALLAFRLVAGESGDEPTRPRTEVVRPSRFSMNILTTVLWLTIFVAPAFSLVYLAGTSTVLENQHVERLFSVDHLGQTLAKSAADYRWPLYWSCAIGAVVAIATTCLAGPSAWIAVRHKVFARWLFLPVVAASMTVPYPVIGILIDSGFSAIPLEAFRQLWDRSILGPVIASTSIAIGPVALLLYLAMKQSVKSVMDVMTIERIDSRRLFFQVGLAANRTAFVAALGVSFLIAVGDVASSFQVLPAGIDTVARSILGQLHSGVDDMTAAISLSALVVANLIAIVTVILFFRVSGLPNRRR